MKKIFYLLNIFLFGFFVFATNVLAADLFITANKSEVTEGDMVEITINVDSSGVAINGAEAVVSFPIDLLSVVSINNSSSIFSLWVEQPKFSNANGTISFGGGLASPGFNSSQGAITKILFRAQKTGNATIAFNSGKVYANDGKGTEVTNNKISKNIRIIPKVVVPVEKKKVVAPVESKPDEKKETVATTTPPVEKIALIKPRLLEMPQVLETGESLIVKGFVNPNINVSFEINGKNLNKKVDTESNVDGYFEFLINDIPDGSYQYFVLGFDGEGEYGEKSQIMNLVVGQTWLDKIIKFVTQYIIYILIGIIILLLILVVIGYIEIKKMKKRINVSVTTEKIKTARPSSSGRLNEVANRLNSMKGTRLP